MCDEDTERLRWGSLLSVSKCDKKPRTVLVFNHWLRLCSVRCTVVLFEISSFYNCTRTCTSSLIVMMNGAKIGQLFPTLNMVPFRCHRQSFGTKRINYYGNILILTPLLAFLFEFTRFLAFSLRDCVFLNLVIYLVI
jgi:hypothetical protein